MLSHLKGFFFLSFKSGRNRTNTQTHQKTGIRSRRCKDRSSSNVRRIWIMRKKKKEKEGSLLVVSMWINEKYMFYEIIVKMCKFSDVHMHKYTPYKHIHANTLAHVHTQKHYIQYPQSTSFSTLKMCSCFFAIASFVSFCPAKEICDRLFCSHCYN